MIRSEFVERIPHLIRWLLIPLASLFSYLLTAFAINILGLILVYFGPAYGGWNEKLFSHLVSPGISGFVAIYVCAILAPSAKRGVAIFISAVWFVLAGGMLALAVWSAEWSTSLAVVSTAVGCGFALSMVQEEVLSEASYERYGDLTQSSANDT